MPNGIQKSYKSYPRSGIFDFRARLLLDFFLKEVNGPLEPDNGSCKWPQNWKSTAEYARVHFPGNKNSPWFIPGEMYMYSSVLFQPWEHLPRDHDDKVLNGDKGTDGRTDGEDDGRTGRTGRRTTDGRTDGRTGRTTDGRDGRDEGRTDGRTDGEDERASMFYNK